MKDRKTGAMLAGGALLAWLLLRGSGGKGADASVRRVRLRVDAAGITADGVATTTAEAIVVARRVGAADVFATGAARRGTVDDLIAALRDAGVKVWIVEGRHA